MSLKIANLHATIDDKEILKGINLEIKAGEIHAVMGPNGSGKSTLAYTLAGHPSYEVRSNLSTSLKMTNKESKVTLNGEDILEMSPDERAQAGLFLAFQYPVEVPGVKVQNFLRQAYEARSTKHKAESKKLLQFDSVLAFRKHLEKLAEEFGVNPELLRRGLNEGFSGGEKKRLEILQMALLQPEYAVLDETDSGLDVDAIKIVAEGVRKIVDRYQTGVIVITHYNRILDYLKPDFVHVLVDGKIVQSGGPELAKEVEHKGYSK